MKKLHICCGDIYLKEYENLDIHGTLVENIKDNPNITTLDKYYKYPLESPRKPIIIDGYLNLKYSWDAYSNNSIDEIVAINCIEHFTLSEAQFIMSEIIRVLIPGGKLIIDFFNIEEIVRQHIYQNPMWTMQLIYCNHKNQYSCHKWGYTLETFYDLLGNIWKIVEEKTIVEHNYSTIGIVAIKDDHIVKRKKK